MAQSEPRRLGVSVELKPHAYDPAINPELFDGVVSRRVVAFLIDFLILSIPVVFVSAGQARLVVRRDTWDDLLSRDVTPAN